MTSSIRRSSTLSYSTTNEITLRLPSLRIEAPHSTTTKPTPTSPAPGNHRYSYQSITNTLHAAPISKTEARGLHQAHPTRTLKLSDDTVPNLPSLRIISPQPQPQSEATHGKSSIRVANASTIRASSNREERVHLVGDPAPTAHISQEEREAHERIRQRKEAFAGVSRALKTREEPSGSTPPSVVAKNRGHVTNSPEQQLHEQE